MKPQSLYQALTRSELSAEVQRTGLTDSTGLSRESLIPCLWPPSPQSRDGAAARTRAWVVVEQQRGLLEARLHGATRVPTTTEPSDSGRGASPAQTAHALLRDRVLPHPPHRYSRKKCFSNKAISRWPLISFNRSNSVRLKSWTPAAMMRVPGPAYKRSSKSSEEPLRGILRAHQLVL